MKLFKAALGLTLVLAGLSANAGEREAEALRRVADGALLIDVRTPGEFNAGHLDGAVNIPYQEIVSRLAEQQVAQEREIVVYCRSGNRSGIAERLLVDAGYAAIFNGGGLRALQQELAAQ